MTCAIWHKPDVGRRKVLLPPPRVARSPVYAVPQIMIHTRVKRAWLATEKRDKIGRKYIGQDNVLVTEAIPTRQAESMMLKVAEEEGAEHSQIRLVAYEGREDVPFA